MKNLFILILVLLIAVPVFCKNKVEHFYTPGLVHAETYTFNPYYMSNVIDVSKRGCETAQYWNCVDNHPMTESGYKINKVSDKVDQDCKMYSNNSSGVPLSSRMIPSIQSPNAATIQISYSTGISRYSIRRLYFPEIFPVF